MRTDRERLGDMLDAARCACRYAEPVTLAEFMEGGMRPHAVLKTLGIIGEAAFHVSPPVKANHPEVPWTEIEGMRLRLRRRTFDLDLDVVWTTVREELPPLIARLERLPEIAGA